MVMDVDSSKVAVVTGAGSGIGLALAKVLGGAGCSVVLADVQSDALAAAEQEVQETGATTLAVRTDVSKPEEVEALADAAVEQFDGVHIVCNNAGVAAMGDPWFGPLEGWQWTMGVNFWGVIHGVRSFLPRVIASGGGHIVNTASIAGLMPGFSPAYDASKHAVVAITEDLFNTMQIAQMPVGVSCLCPGWVRTGIIDADRNWPSELGPSPVADAGQEVMMGHVRRAIDEGMPPAAVADLVVDAVREDRFWVFPHPDFLELAMDRFHRIGDVQDPEVPEEVPGMPPQSQVVAEVMAAMAEAAGDTAG